MKRLIIGLALSCLLLAGCQMHVGGLTTDEDTGEVVSQSYEYENGVYDISVYEDLGNLVIEKGDSFRVECSFPEKYMPTVTCKDNKLTITHENESTNVNTASGWKIYMTIPESCTINNLELEVNLGDIKMNDVSCNDFSCQSNLGNVKLNNVSISKIDLEVNSGNLTGKNISFESGKIESNLGDVTLDGNISDNVSISANLGTITINGNKVEED